MRARIKPEQQIQRINTLIGELEGYRSLSMDELKRKPSSKSWSIIEVIKHMSIGQDAYREKINKALISSRSKEMVEDLRCSAIPSYLIKKFPPVEGKIKMKMKTAKKFEPINVGENMDIVINELVQNLEELKSWINKYRTSEISMKKFNSAIGPVVRFNVPEACEFILCHDERHFYQMRKIKG